MLGLHILLAVGLAAFADALSPLGVVAAFLVIYVALRLAIDLLGIRRYLRRLELGTTFTLLSMSKIWNEAFLKPHPAGGKGERSAAGMRPAVWAVSALAVMTVAIGLGAGPVMDYAIAAADQLGAPAGYIAAVIGTGGH